MQAWDPVFPQILENCFEAYSCEFIYEVGPNPGEASCTKDGILQCCYWACEQNHAACSDACLAGYDECCAENDCSEPPVAEACSNVVLACESGCWTEFNDCEYGWNSCEYTALASFVENLQQQYIGGCDWTTQPVPFGWADDDFYCQQP